jgi:hypothetical protein
MCGRSDGFGPVGWWHGRLEEKGVSNIVNGADGSLGLAVLSGGVGIGQTQANTMRCEVGGDGGVNESSPIVGLHGNKGS